jgi:hypothetical protein
VNGNGIDGVRKRLATMEQRAADLTPAWDKVQNYLADVEGEQFATHGARLGTPWEPLDPKCRLWKIKAGRRQLLVLTGGLRDSFMGRGRYAIRDRDRNRKTAKFGSKHPLAHIHQRGTDGGKIPARPILAKTPEVQHRIQQILEEHIKGK